MDKTAIQVRREIIQEQELNILAPVEKNIFAASTKLQIKDIDEKTLVEKLSGLFRMIAIDVGYNIPGAGDWQYIQTRLLDILKRYYSDLTLSDIKIAFELAVTGGLDSYLPRDSQGNPDRKHYQQFNADYFAKILNAYKKRQNDVFAKVYEAKPQTLLLSNKEKEKHDRQRMQDNINVLLKYKYTGRLEFALGDEIFIYDWLLKNGIADEIKATDEDRQQAYRIYIQRAARGMVNKYRAQYVRSQGKECEELDFTAYEIARRKEIKKAFDIIIKNEIQITNLK